MLGRTDTQRSVHDHPSYFVCPDLLCAVGETSYGILVGFIGSTQPSLSVYVTEM